MQNLNWNDLRFLLAISRRNRIAEAAKMLNVDYSTVLRRLAALQDAMGQRLYQRLPDGRLELTAAGKAAAAIAERMEGEIGSLDGGGRDAEGVSGVVRLTSVPFIVNRILVPTVGTLLDRHPNLRIEMVSDAQDLSLTRREADMALRLARPKTGGLRVKARRVGVLHYAPYSAATHGKPAASSLPWVTYDETMAHLPQARWMAAAIKKDAGQTANLKVSDVEAAFEAVIAGHGQSMLPCAVADRDVRLRRMPPRMGHQTPTTREVWLLIHSELSKLPRSQAVADWIEEVIPSQIETGRAKHVV